MADWFDSDDNTTDTNESFGFFGEEDAGNSTTTAETTTDTAEQGETGGKLDSFKERVGKKNFVLIIIMLVGAAIIVVVSLIFGADSNKPKETTQSKPTQQVSQNTTTTKPAQTTSGYADWKDMTGATFETGVEKTALFTVTDYKLYARNSGGKVAPLEVRVEVWGAIAGYDGLYKLDVPYDLISYIDSHSSVEDDPVSFNVTFKVGVYGENKVIYDITP